MEYQQRIRNGGNVQIDSTSLPRIKNSNAYSKSYFGPDDDYWYVYPLNFIEIAFGFSTQISQI